MKTLANDWSQLDVIWENQGRFYDWRQYRKGGNSHFGSADTDPTPRTRPRARPSSTSARRRRASACSWSCRSMTGTLPLEPMRRFEGDPRCADLSGWSGPATTRPTSPTSRPTCSTSRLGTAAYDLQDRCESLLTSDWVVGQVRQALKETGRLGNTLQILTADNGFLMGDHRLEGKLTPYSTSVPLYMRWPRVLGGRKKVVLEPVANIDLAPTICALAGCTMPKADGRSLVPLIKGQRKKVGRKFIFTEMLHAESSTSIGPRAARPGPASSPRTEYSDTLWAYARYSTGEEELYNISRDPHHLRNLAGKPAFKSSARRHASVLAQRLERRRRRLALQAQAALSRQPSTMRAGRGRWGRTALARAWRGRRTAGPGR